MRMAKVISDVNENGLIQIQDGHYKAWASFVMPSHDTYTPPERNAWVLVDYIDPDGKHPVVLATIQCDHFTQDIILQMGMDKAITLKANSIEVVNDKRSLKIQDGRCDFFHENEGLLTKLKELLQEILNNSSQYALTPCGPGALDGNFIEKTQAMLTFLEGISLSQ